MKRKRFIPLLLVLTLSTSALSFSPTWGEPVTESGDSFLSGENEETESSVTSSNMVSTHYSALEERATDSDLSQGEEFEEPSAFEKLDTKEEFYHYFVDHILDPIPVSINLDKDKYYDVKDGRAYYLDLSGNANSNPILAKLAKTIREKIDPSLDDDDNALGGLLSSDGVMAGGSPFVIRFKKFESGEKLAYLVYQGFDKDTGEPGKKYLIPLKGTNKETFNFIVSGNVNQFNLPKNKEICDHNMGEIIRFLKENYPEIKEIHFMDRNIQSEGEGREKQYYYSVEYTDEHGERKPARVNVGSLQNLGNIPEEWINFLSKNLSFPFDEGRFVNNPSFTEEELAKKNTLTLAEIKEIKGKFSRIINNALTGVLSVEVAQEIVPNVDVRMVEFTHGETPDYGIKFTVKTEKSGDVEVTLPITYSAALNVSSVFSLENADLENLELSPDKNYVYEKRGTGNAVRSLKEYLKSTLNEGETLRTPELKDKVLPPDGVYLVKYNKEILYPVYKGDEFVRNLRVNLNDAMSEETGYHNYIFAKNMRYDGDKMEDDFPVILITEEDRQDIEKVLRTELGESLSSVEFPNQDKVSQNRYSSHFVKTTLHFVDGSSEDLSVYLTGNLESLPSFGEQPLYKLESDRICGGEVIRPEDPKTPENPTEPVNPTNPVNPVNPDNGNSNGNGGGNGGGNSGGGSRTPIVEESQTPAVLSASREAVSSNGEVLGEERPTPTVLGVERKGRGFIKTEDRSNPFSFTLFGISVIGLAFWALQEKKKRA